ncbi:MAG: PLP-dependent aminotransferase family protein [Gammaproteobacteria bacterium]|nr:PLP-dependent aminotransferase family protein [Gammaproteobacteria bacterium]
MIYDFAVGRTNPETFPLEPFQRAATRAIARDYELLTTYPGELGHERLRKLMAQRESEREGVAVTPERISLTNGSMQAVTLVAEALMERDNNIVITEEFTYPGTISTYRDLGIRMVGLPIDEHGMCAVALERALTELEREGTSPRFIYTEATYQNPTGTMMPRPRREAILALAKRFNVILVEDNCYGDVHYTGSKPPAFYALDDYENQIYLCSLSKIFAPGARLGYFMASPKLFRRILNRRHDAGSNTLAASIVAEYLEGNLWEHCAEQNAVLVDKRDLLLDMLGTHLEELCCWSAPAGGLFLWLRFPDDVDRDKLQALADERGFRYARGRAFQVNNEDAPYLRLAFGHVPDAAIREGIPVLAQCIREARTSNEPGKPGSLFR